MNAHRVGIVGSILVLHLLLVPGADAQAQIPLRESRHGHLPEGLGCGACHTTEGWSPIKKELGFQHPRVAGLPLEGKHTGVACASCHEDLRFDVPEVPIGACATCHLDVHQGTLGAECTRCHSLEGFGEVSGIRIHQGTGFPLEGAHLQVACESCHGDDRGGSYSPLDPRCVSCHADDYRTPRVVDHLAAGFDEDCSTCHSTLAWAEVGSFDHAAFSNGFELPGLHGELLCSRCHVPGSGVRFSPASPDDCLACHQADYQREHAGSGYPTTCGSCHSSSSWEGATADHAALSGGFTLLGNHGLLACTSCHVLPGFQNLFTPNAPDDCLACHVAEFQREHGGTGYPTACLTCHVITSWQGATFNHDAAFFPIDSGKHQGKWSTCGDCHTSPSDSRVFSCLNCHEHNQTAMDDKHKQETGYAYDSQACLSCHPRGTK